MPIVIRSPQAEDDLDSIGHDVAERMQSLESAFRVLDAIEETIELAAQYPQSGQGRPDLGRNVRQFTVRNYDYVVFFREAEEGIELVRVLHAARDIPNVFHQP